MILPIIKTLPIGENVDGNVLKFADKKTLRESEELYFSSVKSYRTKGWKLHKEMIMRLGVITGQVSFCFYSVDESHLQTTTLDFSANALILVPPNIWFAFRNEDTATAVIVNLASIEHSEEEVLRRPLDSLEFIRKFR